MSYLDRDTFARYLAEALIQSDNEQQQQHKPQPNSDNDEVVSTTYRLLCHDDPTNLTSAGCHALAIALLRCDPVHDGGNNNIVRGNQTKIFPKYALSNRLVEGIIQCADRTETATTKHNRSKTAGLKSEELQNSVSNTIGMNRVDNEEVARSAESEEQLLGSSYTSLLSNQSSNENELSLGISYSTLAWYAFGRIPLACFLSNDWTEVMTLLGSFRIVESVEISSSHCDADDKEQRINDMFHTEHSNTVSSKLEESIGISQNHAPMHGNGCNVNGITVTNDNHVEQNQGSQHCDDSSEVWAAESDPSDYEYESDWKIDEQIADLDEWALKIQSMYDPIELSKPQLEEKQSEEDKNRVRSSIHYLVRQLTAGRLASISINEWSSLQISDYLIQVILTLSLASQPNGLHNTSPVLEYKKSSTETRTSVRDEHDLQIRQITCEDWQDLAQHLLEVFRNLVLERFHCNHQPTTSILLDDFLRMTTTLMKVYEATSSSTFLTKRIDIPAASLMGVAALSSVCSDFLQLYHQYQNKPSRSTDIPISSASTQKEVLVAIQSIQSTIEQSSDELNLFFEVYTSNERCCNISSFLWMFLSIFQILAIPTTSRLSGSNEIGTIASTRSQIILNSGLFRQLLLSWKLFTKSDWDTDQRLLVAVEDCIFDLCIGSPNLLGKYAWRFPNFATKVTGHAILKPVETILNTTVSSTHDSTQQIPRAIESFQRIFSWNLLGMHLEEASNTVISATVIRRPTNNQQVRPNGSKLLLKGFESEVSAPLSFELLRNRALASFQSICRNVSEILTSWMNRREHDEELSNEWILQKATINELPVLTRSMTTKPMLQKLFCTHLVNNTENDVNDSDPKSFDSKGIIIQDEMQRLHKELKLWPSNNKLIREVDGTNNEADDRESAPKRKDRHIKEEEMCIANLRIAIKSILLLCENNEKHLETSLTSCTSTSKVD